MASLARIDWHFGQVLRPDDFEALEESLSEEAKLRSAGLGLPLYGWHALTWDANELLRGILRIDKLVAVLPSGSAIRAEDNIRLPEALALKKAGTSTVDVYLHVQGPDLDLDTRSSANTTAKIVLRTELSFRAAAAEVQSICVGRFETLDGKAWELSPALTPPLLRLQTTPYLYSNLLGLRARLVRYDEELTKHVAEARRSVGPVQAYQRGRAEVWKALALLDDALLGHDSPAWARQHPSTILAMLRALLVELSLVEGNLPDVALPRYDHDNLAKVFCTVLAALDVRLNRLPPATPTLPFYEDAGRFVIADVPADVLNAPAIYLLIERPTAFGELPLERYNVRLADPSRIPWLNQHSTRGIRPVRTVAAPADFGARFDIYSLPSPGRTAEEQDEWRYIRSSRSMGFLIPPELRDARASLYWTYSPSAAS